MKIKRAIQFAAVGLAASVLVLLTAIGIHADVSSGSPDETTPPPPEDDTAPAGSANIGDAADPAAPPAAGVADQEPPPPGTGPRIPADSDATVADPAAECDRRLAANESVFIEALETGEGAAFHCTTTCEEPSVDLNESRAGSVTDLRAEVDLFKTNAESTADAATGKFCLTKSGYERPKVGSDDAARASWEADGSPVGGEEDGLPPARDDFIPEGVFDREDYPGV